MTRHVNLQLRLRVSFPSVVAWEPDDYTYCGCVRNTILQYCQRQGWANYYSLLCVHCAGPLRHTGLWQARLNMGGTISYKKLAGTHRTTIPPGGDPHENVDPFTYRLNMTVLDWAKVSMLHVCMCVYVLCSATEWCRAPEGCGAPTCA